jgi:hypothetical protein
MDRVATMFLASLGAICIYAGYRLFCDLPVLRREGQRANRAAVLLVNMIPGALLALFGAALITTEARGMLTHRPAIRYQAPAAQGTSWHRENPRPFGRPA